MPIENSIRADSGGFSIRQRSAAITEMSRAPVDVAILGGGAAGCSAAAHLAAIGVRVALLEKEDIASGASGNSTGLAHAGLRYLAQGRFVYVLHESRERLRLEGLAPQWVRPFHFMFPVYRGDAFSLRMVRLGTRVYDAMARLESGWHGERMPRKAGVCSAAEVLSIVPGLRADGLQGATKYYVDAQLQDARFTLGLAQQAHSSGALIVTRAHARPARERTDGRWTVVCEDRLEGTSFELNARLVINATGAWIDEVRSHAGRKSPALVEPSRGIHLVIDRMAEIPLIFAGAEKGRIFFVLPYGRDASLVGTTDTFYKGPADAARPTPLEVKELLGLLFRFFPTLEEPDFEARRIRDVYWGLRPLVRQGGLIARASREHAIIEDAPAWWSLVGVKLTAARAAGEELALRATRVLGRAALKEIHLRPLPGGEIPDYEGYMKSEIKMIQGERFTEDVASYLLDTYGTRAREVTALCRQEPALAERVMAEEPWIYAQVLHAAREEMALTLNDVMWRRTKWAHFKNVPRAALERIAAVMAKAHRWSADRRLQEIAAYEMALRSHRLPL